VSDDAIRLDTTSAWPQGTQKVSTIEEDAGHAHDAGAAGWNSARVDIDEYGSSDDAGHGRYIHNAGGEDK